MKLMRRRKDEKADRARARSWRQRRAFVEGACPGPSKDKSTLRPTSFNLGVHSHFSVGWLVRAQPLNNSAGDHFGRLDDFRLLAGKG